MTLLSAYKAATPLKAGPVSWVKEVTEPHLPKGWTKYVCSRNGKKISKLVQYRDSDGKKYKSLKAVEDYLSEIILRNNWQNVAPWNEFLKRMVTVNNQKPALKMPNPVGRPRKDKSNLTAKTNQITQPSLTTPPPPPPQSQPVLPNPVPGGLASELMVTNHFRARRPPGPPGPDSPQPVVQTTLPADKIKLEPEEFKEEPTDSNPPPTLEITVPPTIADQKKSSPNDEKELVLPKHKTPLNTFSINSPVPVTDISKETSKKFQCSVCHLIFVDKVTLMKHLTVHQQCNICNILFKTKGTWIKHMENVHKDEIQKKKVDSKNIQKPNKLSDSQVETTGKHNEVMESNDTNTTDSLMETAPMETAPIKLEASPILSDDQLSVNRKRLTSIGDVLEEDQNEIELSFSHKSAEKRTEADKPSEIEEEPLNTSNLILEESLDNSNMVLDESTAGVVETKSLSVNETNKDLANEEETESKRDKNETESEKSSIPLSTENGEVALRWYDGTFFTCRVMKSSSVTCGKEFIGRKPFRLHLGHDHGVRLKTNELNGLKTFASKSKERTYKCKSCFKIVKHDLFGISHHLMKTHSLTIDDYARQFETGEACKPAEESKGNDEDARNIEPIQSYGPVEGSKENDVDGKKMLTENPEIILKKSKLNSQILLGEKQLKENEKHIEELNVSNSAESLKISESSKQVEILKSELFERIAAIEREKEALLKKASEYDEVIMENLNQTAKIEQVNNNRMYVLEKMSGEITENISKAKAELEALLNEKEEKIMHKASIKEENISMETNQEKGLKKSNEQVSHSKEPEPKLPIKVTEIKDEKEKETDTIVTTTKTTIKPTKQKSVLAIKGNTSKPLQDQQEAAGDNSNDKNRVNNENPQKGSILEQKINALKRKSTGSDLVKEPSSTACSVPEENSDDSSKAEGKVIKKAGATNPHKRGRKKISEDVRNALKGVDGDASSAEGPVENSQVEASQPKKRGRKKLSDEEKAARKAIRIDSKKLTNTKPTGNQVDNGFVFEDIETEIPGVPCVPAAATVKDKVAEKTGSKQSLEKSEELVEKNIDGTKTTTNAFQNVQDSIHKSKKKLQPKNSGLEPQRAVRDLSDLFAEIDEESDMLEKKGDETKEKTDNSPKGTQCVMQATKKAGNSLSNKKGRKRNNIHMSNGNVEGAQCIENINKKGRNSL